METPKNLGSNVVQANCVTIGDTIRLTSGEVVVVSNFDHRSNQVQLSLVFVHQTDIIPYQTWFQPTHLFDLLIPASNWDRELLQAQKGDH